MMREIHRGITVNAKTETTPILTSRRAGQQRGTALIISLIILLLMTLLGVTGMQTTLVQERIAGNVRDRNLAFEAAEAALRQGESYLADNAVVGPFNGANGLYQPVASGDPRWEVVTWTNQSHVQPVDFSVQGTTLARNPAYIIEELAPAPADPTGSLAADAPLPTMRFYRITARGWGGSDMAVVQLQTVFRRQ